jgi:2'-5' RNA ligase
MKRTFIAVKIEAGDQLAEIFSMVRSEFRNDSIKWVDINQMHLTLAFLGDTGEETINQVSSMLKKSCTGFGEINFTISGLGVFRNINDPRVIWAGIETSEKLSELFNIIKRGLESIGITTEERQFKPHLTVGRVKRLKNRISLEQLIEQYNQTKFQEVSIREVVYYQSILQQEGPLYAPIMVAGLI